MYLAFYGIFMLPQMSVSKILAHRRLWYQNFTEMTSNTSYIVAFGFGLKCLRKILFNTQWGEGGSKCFLVPQFRRP